jgi:hypothetical protein
MSQVAAIEIVRAEKQTAAPGRRRGAAVLFGERSGRRREHSLGEASGQGGGEKVPYLNLVRRDQGGGEIPPLFHGPSGRRRRVRKLYSFAAAP